MFIKIVVGFGKEVGNMYGVVIAFLTLCWYTTVVPTINVGQDKGDIKVVPTNIYCHLHL